MIRALTPQGLRHVAEWARGIEASLALGPEHSQIASTRPCDWSRLEELARKALELRPGDPALDTLIAPALHASLPLGRRVASDRHVWGWLGADPLVGLLQHRWPRGTRDETGVDEERGSAATRYVGRLTEHGLGRLWWAAELTWGAGRDGYDDSRRLLEWQYLLGRLLSSQILRSRPVMLGVLDALTGTSDWEVVNDVMRRLRALAVTVCLDAMDRAEVAALARQVLREGPRNFGQ